MAQGSMWWWVIPLAPGVPDEYLRTFTGKEGVLGRWVSTEQHLKPFRKQLG
jgi:hypothetical protein